MTAGLRRDDEASPVVPEQDEWIGPYRLIEQLGEGGMGVVHLALAPSGRAVAIKVLRAHIAHDHEARSRLAREVQTLARVQDARVAAVLDADTEGLRPYIVTRYIPGPALDRVVSEDGPLQGEALLRLGRGLTGALHAIHAAGVIHRDLKPANVLLLDGDPVVIDFGIAHVADDIRLTMTGLVMGTPGYLSPEVVEGDRSPRPRTGGAGPPRWPSPHPVFRRSDEGRWVWCSTVSVVGRRTCRAWMRGWRRCCGRPCHRWQTSGRTPMRSSMPWTGMPLARRRPSPSPSTTPCPSPQRQPPGPSATQALDQQDVGAEDRETFEDAQSDPEQDSDWWAGWQTEPGQPDPRIGRPARIGTLLALMVGALGTAAVWPVVAVGLIILWFWCARFADRSVTSLVVRRHESGRRRRDVPIAVVASPWHVISSAVATVIALLLPATIAIASTFSAALAVAAISGGDPQPARSLPLVAGGFLGLMMGWWGPGGASLRRGSRSLVRGVAPGKTTTEVVVTILILLGGRARRSGLAAARSTGCVALGPGPVPGHLAIFPAEAQTGQRR